MSKRKSSPGEILDHQNLYGNGKRWCRGELIGKGCSGSVFLATTLKKPKLQGILPATMAVKSAQINDSAPLQKERMILNKLRSPYILKCYGEEITIAGHHRMVYNLLIEYGSGGTLADLIKKSGGIGLPEQDVRFYTRCMLLGLGCTHRRGGYVHRDLAPENVVLVPSRDSTSTGYVAKIGDYGSAKLVKNIEKMRLLEPYLRGRIRYLPPEAVVHSIQVPASDIWALGCIVVEMLTGKSIWEGKTNSEINDNLYAIGKGRKVCFDLIPVGVPEDARNFLRGCFAAKVEERLPANELLRKPFVAGISDDAEDKEEEVDVSLSEMISNCSVGFGDFQGDARLGRLSNEKRNIYSNSKRTQFAQCRSCRGVAVHSS